jgi:hypothetical protein
MSNDTASAERIAAAKFARFNQRPEILRMTAKSADWAESDIGLNTNVQLAALAMLRLSGRITRQVYMASVRKLATKSGLPLADFRLIATYSLELTRCMLTGSGQIPIMPESWDDEEGGGD